MKKLNEQTQELTLKQKLQIKSAGQNSPVKMGTTHSRILKSVQIREHTMTAPLISGENHFPKYFLIVSYQILNKEISI